MNCKTSRRKSLKKVSAIGLFISIGQNEKKKCEKINEQQSLRQIYGHKFRYIKSREFMHFFYISVLFDSMSNEHLSSL